MKKIILFTVTFLLIYSCTKNHIEIRGVEKYTLCHFNEGSPVYNKLNLPETGLNNHLDNHLLDRLPGDTVTIDGALFCLDEDCALF